ncbi:MAG TPA: hypothetical protein PLM08_25590, partial [Polyangiaceae bacterium]|nr:hypothetical protein [Polyangiaceae bacterium]
MRSQSLTVFPALLLLSGLALAQADYAATMPAAGPAALTQDVDAELAQVNHELQQLERHIDALRVQSDVVRQRTMARARTYYHLTH